MSEYNFAGISGDEFERVVRDLLQDEYRIRFETSPRGPDSGIDLRHVDNAGKKTVVQCKHFLGSTASTFVSKLRREELPKILRVNPDRYILVTSQELTPAVKDEILALFNPYIRSTGDILGGADVNNLLGRWPAVADRHIKLWLTSEPVLRRVLHSGIFDDTELDLERVRRHIARYVPNPSLGRARKILEDQHVCIIAGLPGIGKTTLAQMLMIEYESRDYQVVRIPNNLTQALGVARRGAKAILYFDDFLGQTILERGERNEDQRVVELMETVRHEPHWRFVLTTREYILEEARLKSEAFARLSLENRTCIIVLDSDYTLPIRARILYQHLYFSDLPTSYTLQLLRGKHVSHILNHRNYSPRLIDLLTSQAHTSSVSASDYPQEFLETLDNPERLWAVAYRAMNFPTQDLVLTMTSMPDQVSLEDLRSAYEALRAYRGARLNQSREPDEFEDALKILDGTMLKTEKRRIGASIAIVVTFHNPSVLDFMQSRLKTHAHDVRDLLHSGVFIDQYIRLFRGDGYAPFPSVLAEHTEFVSGVSRTINGKAAHFPVGDNPPHPQPHIQSRESRALFAFDVAQTISTPAAAELRDSTFAELQQYFETGGKPNKSHAIIFLKRVFGDVQDINQRERFLIRALLNALIEDAYWDDDIHTLMEVYEIPGLFEEVHIDALKKAIRRTAKVFAEDAFSPESRQLFSDAAYILREAAEMLRMDIDDLLSSIENRAENAEDEPEAEYDDDRYQVPPSHFDSDQLFERLESELESRGPGTL